LLSREFQPRTNHTSDDKQLVTGGMFVDMFLIIVFVALGIGIGGASTGGDLVTPILGALVLAFYGWALIGIGAAVGGIFGSRLATPVVVIVVLLTWFVELLGPLLNLPDFVQNLALTKHFGQPMLGNWDFVGIAAAVAIGVIGVGLGAWGFRRRDLRS
jgi:ABC-2 type transport system permease protein